MQNIIKSEKQNRLPPAFERCAKIVATFYTTPREFTQRLYVPPQRSVINQILPGVRFMTFRKCFL